MTAPAPFQKIVDELLDGGKSLSRRALQNFSDIDPASLQLLLDAWPRVRPERKHLLLQELKTLAEHDTLVCFDDFARALLHDDTDSHVRALAVRLLEECDDLKLVPAYLDILAHDEGEEARREAAAALGKFVQLGELEEIPLPSLRRVEAALLETIEGQDRPSVRRQALESLGYSARQEAAALIEHASRQTDPDWVASALVAMGRSSDEAWEEEVLSRMADDEPRVQLAAVEAAGELGLKSAVPGLLKILEDVEDDEIASSAIWSLSQIGGEDARIYIENLLDQTEDEDQIAYLEEALDNLSFTQDLNSFDMLSYDTDLDE